MSEEETVKEPTFEDVLAALQQLDVRITRIETVFDKHEHKGSGEVVLRVG